MSYNEYKYEKVKNEYSAIANKFILVDEFIATYASGLKDYLMRKSLHEGHIEDLAVANAEFAEAFLITVEVLDQ